MDRSGPAWLFSPLGRGGLSPAWLFARVLCRTPRLHYRSQARLEWILSWGACCFTKLFPMQITCAHLDMYTPVCISLHQTLDSTHHLYLTMYLPLPSSATCMHNPICSGLATQIRIKFTQDSLCFAHVSRCFARVSRTFRGMFRTFRACFARFRGCFARLRIDHPPAKFTFCTVGAHILTFCA